MTTLSCRLRGGRLHQSTFSLARQQIRRRLHRITDFGRATPICVRCCYNLGNTGIHGIDVCLGVETCPASDTTDDDATLP
jgi:hypothetical protein